MKKWKQSLWALSVACMSFFVNAHAIEFIEVGNKSLGMGGVGVSLKDNPQGMFFNPALVADDKFFGLGYSLGASLNEKNMLNIVSFNLSSINDITRFNDLLKSNQLRAHLQGALSAKIGNLGFGTVALGFVSNMYANASFSGYLPTSTSTVAGSGINFNFASIRLTEVPITYAYDFETPLGNLALGVALKIINANYKYSSSPLDVNFSPDNLLEKIDFRGGDSKNGVGLDIGLNYAPNSLVSVGLVAKNLNTPTFAFNGYDLKLRPQMRLGASFNVLDTLVIAADADLTNNDVIIFGNERISSQKVGVGASFDAIFFDVRVGIAKDVRQDNGAILSVGLGGFGIVDVALAVSTETSPYINGNRIPRYVSLQVGGGFSF